MVSIPKILRRKNREFGYKDKTVFYIEAVEENF